MQIGNDLRESTKRGKLCKKKKELFFVDVFCVAAREGDMQHFWIDFIALAREL